jgi:hypothetical protein
MEQMQPGGLQVVPVDYNNDDSLPLSVKNTHPLIYLDGDTFCCVLGPDPVSGIFGRGDSLKDALDDFDKHFQELLQRPVPGDPVSEYIQGRHV